MFFYMFGQHYVRIEASMSQVKSISTNALKFYKKLKIYSHETLSKVILNIFFLHKRKGR